MTTDTAPAFSFTRMFASMVQGRDGLIVIDTNQDAHVRILADAFCKARWSHLPGSTECDPLTFSSMQIALRSLLPPPPPKPEEPAGFAAVVEDVDGKRWIRDGMEDDGGPWFYGPAPRGEGWQRRSYDAIAAVRVLSEGVPS